MAQINLFQYLNLKLVQAIESWNIYTTALIIAIVSYLVYVVVTSRDPDTHPMILLRQSSASLVRQPGESAIYRSPDTPHGFPLRTGLKVKPVGAPPYSGALDGDLRDIWRRVTGDVATEHTTRPAAGSAPTATASDNVEQKIFSVMGREEIINHKISDITKEIVVIGDHVKKHGGKRVALYMPNSIEILAAIFGMLSK